MTATTALVLRILRAAKKRQTYIAHESEWATCREAGEHDSDTIRRIAELSKRNWLFNSATGVAKFFEGN